MRIIDADALKAALRTDKGAKVLGHSVHRLFCMDSMIDELPTIDAVPVVHGRWECVNEGENVWMCSGENGCGNEILLLEGTPTENQWDFCPSCGAKMDGGDDDGQKKS